MILKTTYHRIRVESADIGLLDQNVLVHIPLDYHFHNAEVRFWIEGEFSLADFVKLAARHVRL